MAASISRLSAGTGLISLRRRPIAECSPASRSSRKSRRGCTEWTWARLYGVDLREAHRKIVHSPGVPSAVVIPRAYEIDDLTYGIIWAVTSLDDALLADDSALDQRQRQLREFEQLPHSAAGSQAAAGLTAAARMWLGSSFCARHILRNLASPQGLPGLLDAPSRLERKHAPGCFSGTSTLTSSRSAASSRAQPILWSGADASRRTP